MSAGLFMLAALAGGAGAVARCVIDHALTRRQSGALPTGTWAVNLSGAFALGLLLGLGADGRAGAGAPVVVGAGFLGAFTTFSTWMYEGLRLLERRRTAPAAAHLAGQLAAGLFAATAGLALGSAF